MFSLLGYILLFISLIGYFVFVRKTFNIKTELIPILIFSTTILILYIGALLNVLLVSSIVILFTGIGLLLYYIVSKKINFSDILSIFTPGIIVFILSCIVIIIFYSNTKLVSYDNFSHWGLLVKQMWMDNRLPNFSNIMINFKSYPPGSALFIYYITKIIGQTEGNMLIAQNILALSCILTLFSFIRNKKFIGYYIIVIVLSPIMLSLPSNMKDLLVDSLLALFALANSALIIYYKSDLKKASLLSIPIMTSALLIKNSSVIFNIFNIILLLIIYIKTDKVNRKSNRSLIFIILSALIPFISLFLWSKHVKLVYPIETLSSSKHAMNLSYYSQTLLGKSSGDIKSICSIFLAKATDLFDPGNTLFLIWNIIIISFFALNNYINKIKSWKFVFYLLFVDIAYLLYQLGLLGMYLFSMPTGEAMVLASYGRYNSTIITYIIGLLIILIFKELFSKKNQSVILKWIVTVSICIVAAYTFTTSNLINRLSLKPSVYSNIVDTFDNSIANIEDTQNKSFVVYSPFSEKDGGYTHYLSRYKLYTNKIKVVPSFKDKEEFDTIIKDFNYLIVLEDNEEINELLNQTSNDTSHIGSYLIKDLK